LFTVSRCKGTAEEKIMITRRRILAATGGLAALATVGAAAAQGSNVSTQARNGMMQIIRNGSRPSAKGPAEYFTGTVRVDPLFQAGNPARVSGGYVTFEPGARSAWHTHPLGQTLIVTSGLGWAQAEGGPVEEIQPGDVVWFPRA
jgi:quercetin dioxygenase-like cupin family protein